MALTQNKNNIEPMFYNRDSLLESPCWDALNQILYCVSIEQCLIYGINTITNEIISYPTEGQVGCVVVDKDGMLISAEKSGIYKINPKTKERKFLIQIESDEEMRYNDGKLDPKGRFLVGTKGYKEEKLGKGKLFSFDGYNTKILIENITISNGIGFSISGNEMYFIDTPTKNVALYKYDMESGEAKFVKNIISISGGAYPDGMCVDLDGMIWVAEWEGGKVCKWDPNSGNKIDEIIMPCNRVTSCCLGGKNMEYLYITTAKDFNKYEELSGGLFRVKIR